MAVEIGDEAPDFELPDQHGTPVKLSSFRGAKNVVLVFYPLAFSPVCSGELCALREDFPEVNRDDVELITVSVDSLFTHRAWADAENFQFSLLADFWPHGAVAKAVRRLRRGQGPGDPRHLRHRQERHRALVRGQPDPAGARHRRLPEGPRGAGLARGGTAEGKITRGSSFGRPRAISPPPPAPRQRRLAWSSARGLAAAVIGGVAATTREPTRCFWFGLAPTLPVGAW